MLSGNPSSSFLLVKHTHGGSESSNCSVSSVVCTAFNHGQVPLGPCSITAARDGNFECSEYIFGAFRGTVFCPQIWGQFLAPLHVDENDSCLWAVAGAILGGRFRRPICFKFSVPEPDAWFRQRCCITRSCHDGLFLKLVMLLCVVPKSSSTFLRGVKTASTNWQHKLVLPRRARFAALAWLSHIAAMFCASVAAGACPHNCLPVNRRPRASHAVTFHAVRSTLVLCL